MEEMFPNIPTKQTLRVEPALPAQSADVPIEDAVEEVAKEESPPKETADGEKLSYWGKCLYSKFKKPVQQKYSWV